MASALSAIEPWSDWYLVGIDGIGLNMCHHLYMNEPYQWTTDDDEIAFDAITVGIGLDAELLRAFDLPVPETVASVYWPDWITQGDKVQSAMEGPYPVPAALERAELLCALWGFNRVVISIQSRALWEEAWGKLSELEGYD